MEIKEVGLVGVFIVGGAFVGVSQLGLGDALSEELRHINDVPRTERAAYMDEVVLEFSETFSAYGIQTDNYMYGGYSSFSAKARKATFVENIRPEEDVPRAAVIEIKALLKNQDFCGSDEMVMFTDKGWNYVTVIENTKGRVIERIECEADADDLRPALRS